MKYKNVKSWGLTDKYQFTLTVLGESFLGYPFETEEDAAFCSDLCKRILTDGFLLTIHGRVKLSLSEDSFVQRCLAEGLNPVCPQTFLQYPKLPEKFRAFVLRNQDAWQASMRCGKYTANIRALKSTLDNLASALSQAKEQLARLESECLGVIESSPSQPATLSALQPPKPIELPPAELGYFVS